MKFLGYMFGRKPPLWSRSALSDPQAAAEQLASIGERPGVLGMNCINLAKAAPLLSETSKLASLLARTPDADHARPYAEMLLVAAVGPRLANAMLARDTVRERWDAVVQLAGTTTWGEVSRGDALRLHRELTSPRARELRAAAPGLDAGGVVSLIADRAADLSPQAVDLILEGAGRTDIAATVARELGLQTGLRDMLRLAGESTIKPMSVKQLLAEDATRTDAYELFVDANDRALGHLATMTDATSTAAESGGTIDSAAFGEMMTELRRDIGHMLEWHDALCKKRDTAKLRSAAEAMLTRLSSIVDELAVGAVTRPVCDRLLEVCAKSKPEVEIATIETIEELIRIMHRETTAGFGAFVQRDVFSLRGWRRKSVKKISSASGGQAEARLTVKSALNSREFAKSPMGVVADGFTRYIEDAVNSKMVVPSAVITDKSFTFEVSLGCHQGRLNVTYDFVGKKYNLEWAMQEPEAGRGRQDFCKEYFPLAGFKHRVDGWKHSAKNSVSPSELPKMLTFLLFSFENMRNLDLAKPCLGPKALQDVFESWYASFSRGQVVLKSSAIEDRVTELAQRDPHLFRMGSRYDAIDTAVAFVMSNKDVLFTTAPSEATLASALNASVRTYEGVHHSSPIADEQLKELIAGATRTIQRNPIGQLLSKYLTRDASAICGPIYQDTI